jgi:twitching motility protein PilT
VNQREVTSDTLDFNGSALKHVLRQDPDVVLIGELRDLETVAAALKIAETGHLTFATLHTNSCAQTINRIIDVFSVTSTEPNSRSTFVCAGRCHDPISVAKSQWRWACTWLVK